MTYEEIFEKSKEIITQGDVSDYNGHLAVQVDISGEGEGAFYIELKDGQVFVEPYEYYDNDCKLIMSAKTWFKLMDGSLNNVAAFTVGKLKVEGSIEKALEFQKICDEARAKAVAAEKAAAKTAKAEKAAAKATEKAAAKTAKAAAKKTAKKS